jgi:hypothetical protein
MERASHQEGAQKLWGEDAPYACTLAEKVTTVKLAPGQC